MKKRIERVMLSLILVFSMTTTMVFANEDSNNIKEEKVYGLLNANGMVDQIIVSNHIQKEKGMESISLKNELQNLRMLMDNVTYKENGDLLEFSTKESDIYYQGTTTKALPVTTIINYYIDGNETTSDQLKGQSGHFKMVIHQENNEKRTINIGGELKDIYVPFETALVVDMDNDVFENVSASTGKIIDDGSVKVLKAVLVPGLKDALQDVESDKIVDTVTIEADVTNFELKPVYMTVICKLPYINISEQLDKLNDVEAKLDDFKSAGTELKEGSDKLNDGVKIYFGKQGEAFNLFNMYLKNDKKLLSSIIAFDGSLREFNKGLTAYIEGVCQVSEGVAKLCETTSSLSQGMTALNGSLSQILPQNEQTKPIFELMAKLQAGMTGVNEGLHQVNTGAVGLKEKAPLITGSSAKLADGAHQLASGANELIVANGKLTDGIDQLSGASTQLVTGVNELANGVTEFKTKGVDELSNEIEKSINNINHFNEVYEKVHEVAESYNNFTGTTDQFESSVVFILKTEGIK